MRLLLGARQNRYKIQKRNTRTKKIMVVSPLVLEKNAIFALVQKNKRYASFNQNTKVRNF